MSGPWRQSNGTKKRHEKGGFETFMVKEIYEQADAVAETIADRAATGSGR